MSEPRAARPTPDWLGGGDLLPWSWARDRLADERNYWVVTARRDGFPQARPLWGVWMDDLLFMSVGHAGIQRAADARVSIHTDSAVHVVIVEGEYERITSFAGDPAAPSHLVGSIGEGAFDRAGQLYQAKYDMSGEWLNFIVRPKVAYGWRDEDVKTATRWTFS